MLLQLTATAMESLRILVDSGASGHTISPEAAALLLAPRTEAAALLLAPRIARGHLVSSEASAPLLGSRITHSHLVCVSSSRRAFLIFIPAGTHLRFHL